MRILQAIIAILIVGCVLPGQATAQNTLPQGTFTTTIVRQDIPAGFPFLVGLFMVGQWTLTIGTDGRYTVAKGDRTAIEGSFKVSDSQVTLTDEKGPQACKGAQVAGIYRWAFDGSVLTMTRVADDCQARALLLTVHSLNRQN